MRYYTDSSTLFISGSFRAASTGVSGGIRSVSTLISHSVPGEACHEDPEKELEVVAAGAGLGTSFLGLINRIPVAGLCVLQYDFITVFVTAEKHDGPESSGIVITLVVCSAEGLTDASLLETIMIATEAKMEALSAAGQGGIRAPGDAIMVAGEGEVRHRSAGRGSEAGRRIREAVLQGVPVAIVRHEDPSPKERPAFYIFSRIKGEHWVEWTPENCPYFPCHFPGQRCDFCYCPFYPCKDESLGHWVENPGKGKVWNCARCTLLHEPELADYLRQHPGASLPELVRRKNSRDEKKR